jgi:hypothetical protein
MSDLKAARRGAQTELGAIAVHHTAADKTSPWDAGANLKRLGDSPSEAALRSMHAWVDPKQSATIKAAYKLPHHMVSENGSVGAANMKAVESAMGRLNGGGLDIPAADRKGVYQHLAAHYKDAGMKAPDLKAAADRSGSEEFFGSDPAGTDDDDTIAEFVPSTADPKKGTIDCVWYGGQMVPRMDPDTGEPYMLNLDMAGCRMDRLNAGAPVFDTHFSGNDFKSLMADKAGTKAQLGVVEKAWADGPKGLATLRFDTGSPEGAEMFRKASTGILRNLSFGAWIYKRAKTSAEALPEGAPPYSDANEIGMFTATDWEPFEISPVPVPADFSTTFLSASGGITRPTGQKDEEQKRMIEQQQLTAARDEGALAERQRVTDIRLMVAPFRLDEKFVSGLINEGLSVDKSREKVMTELAANAQKTTDGKIFPITGESATVTRDEQATRFGAMQSALLLRYDPKFGLRKRTDHSGHETPSFLNGFGPDYQKQLEDQGREFRSMTLLELAKESLQIRGINPRGMHRNEIAARALAARAENFAGGAESSSDFPSILANVANKSLRVAYEAYPRTFQPLARQVTATDFKPVNRVQLSDAPSLQKLNEAGEFHRANLSDSNQNYSLATFGEIVALTRKVIINDDLQAFTRVPAILGVAAARLESDTVWAVITGNQVMQADNVALFNAAHNNLLTGAGSSLITNGLTALAAGRKALRLQTGPQGTPLNLIPRFIIMPAALETYGLQVVYPINIASTDVTKVVPEWVRSLVPVVEPRLDANSAAAWYLAADPAQIDTIEYCYLEGQEGVFIETRQGFDVDGVEIKARMDFAAAAIDYRGLQENAGA